MMYVYLHGLRHHVMNATVTQRMWFSGNICKIWHPIHSFMFITVKTLVADNLVHVCIHDNHNKNYDSVCTKTDLKSDFHITGQLM